jgi:hypothetical protein
MYTLALLPVCLACLPAAGVVAHVTLGVCGDWGAYNERLRPQAGVCVCELAYWPLYADSHGVIMFCCLQCSWWLSHNPTAKMSVTTPCQSQFHARDVGLRLTAEILVLAPFHIAKANLNP